MNQSLRLLLKPLFLIRPPASLHLTKTRRKTGQWRMVSAAILAAKAKAKAKMKLKAMAVIDNRKIFVSLPILP